MYFTANPNGEAEVIKVTLDAVVQAKNAHASIFLERSFADIDIKGRTSKGNILTKKPVHRIGLKSHGHSTLGGRKVWYDPDVNRLNYDEHGRLLGEFFDDDQILVILKNGDFYLTNFDANNHYEENILRIEKFQPDKVWTCVLFDADNQGYPYMKRFLMEATKRKQNFLGENPASKIIICSPTWSIRSSASPTAASTSSAAARTSMPSSSLPSRASRPRASASPPGRLRASRSWSPPDSPRSRHPRKSLKRPTSRKHRENLTPMPARVNSRLSTR